MSDRTRIVRRGTEFVHPDAGFLEFLGDAQRYICPACGARANSVTGSWRWNGTTWEHCCEGRERLAECGYTAAVRDA